MIATLKGFITKETYASGSKSEHEAVVIHTDENKYFLRREGGNPFFDPDLDSLNEHYVEVSGRIQNDLFYVISWKILE